MNSILKLFGYCLLISLPCSISWALATPKYLTVEGWQNCVQTMTRGQAKFICLPAEKLETCPEASWRKLKMERLVANCIIN